MLFADSYIAQRSGHSRGSTLDVTLVPAPASTAPYREGQPLVDCAAAQDVRFPDNSVDMGTVRLLRHPGQHGGSPDHRRPGQNRLLLGEGLERHGFVNYDKGVVAFHLHPGRPG